LLFVLTAGLLQSILNSARHEGLLKLPISERCGADSPVIQYTDDTLIVLEACLNEMIALKVFLNTFTDSTGLRVNYHKSKHIPN
jgi:hypothetical protein